MAEKTTALASLWQTFREHAETRLGGPGSAKLRPPCAQEALDSAAGRLGRSLPRDLAALHSLADGQTAGAPGILPGNCRWNAEQKEIEWKPGLVIGSHCRLLSLAEALTLYEQLRDDEELDVFQPTRVPFAANADWTVLCADCDTNAIWLLWTDGPDWTQPREWQTLAQQIAPDLASFLTAPVPG